MTVTYINATGHPVRRRYASGDLETYPTSPVVIRPDAIDVAVIGTDDPDVVQRVLVHESLPPVREGVFYIVSRKVATVYASLRQDFVYPDTEDGAERNDTGGVYAVRRFRRPDCLGL